MSPSAVGPPIAPATSETVGWDAAEMTRSTCLTGSGSSDNRSVTRSERFDGTGRFASGTFSIPRRTSARPSSRARNGFPADCLVDAKQQRAREARGQLRAQQVARRLERHRPDHDPFDPVVREGALESEGKRMELLSAHGHDETDRCIVQAPKRELQHSGRGRVQPRCVIDRNHRRAPRSEREQGAVEGGRDRPLVGWEPVASARRRATSRADRWGEGSRSRLSSTTPSKRSPRAA
jgi:hypothetical protein